jgi:hypothetical protein
VRVLLFRAGALGDLLLLRPAITALRRAGHRVGLVAPQAVGRVLLGPGAAEDVLASDGPELAAALAGAWAKGPLAGALGEADAVVGYTRSQPALEALARIARRLIVRDPSPPVTGPHAARWLAEAVAPLAGASFAERSDPGGDEVLAFTEEEQREAQARLRGLAHGFLALHTGSGSPSKCWPLERFREAARSLAGEGPWLFVAGPAEEGVPAPAGALVARDWPPRVLAAALARASLFLGNDSGVSHLAAAAGAPTLALFGPTDPALWSPLGPRVVALRAADATLASLEVAAVVAAGEKLRSAGSGLPSG